MMLLVRLIVERCRLAAPVGRLEDVTVVALSRCREQGKL